MDNALLTERTLKRKGKSSCFLLASIVRFKFSPASLTWSASHADSGCPVEAISELPLGWVPIHSLEKSDNFESNNDNNGYHFSVWRIGINADRSVSGTEHRCHLTFVAQFSPFVCLMGGFQSDHYLAICKANIAKMWPIK
ncbi:hypothetical protein M513_07495 [Trichuris suis]|uniref:Uncharacterized protein n=1 Tax=Trichuris suis TaxID=68888 RepID=A0A085M320_9BILA|nr:hypothetical protein M513_07495 [Trichuris suis]